VDLTEIEIDILNIGSVETDTEKIINLRLKEPNSDPALQIQVVDLKSNRTAVFKMHAVKKISLVLGLRQKTFI